MDFLFNKSINKGMFDKFVNTLGNYVEFRKFISDTINWTSGEFEESLNSDVNVNDKLCSALKSFYKNDLFTFDFIANIEDTTLVVNNLSTHQIHVEHIDNLVELKKLALQSPFGDLETGDTVYDKNVRTAKGIKNFYFEDSFKDKFPIPRYETFEEHLSTALHRKSEWKLTKLTFMKREVF